MPRKKIFTLATPITTVYNGLEDFNLRKEGLIEGIASHEWKLFRAMFETVEKARNVDGGALVEELTTEIGQACGSMNSGKPIQKEMVNKLRAIGDYIDGESVDQLNGCASVRSLKAIAQAKGISRTLKNEIVKAIGKAGGVYSDKDLIELAKFAKTKEASGLSAAQIVERKPAGCHKAQGAEGAESGQARIMRMHAEEYEARTGKAPKNANTLADWVASTLIPQSQAWVEENGEEL